MHNELVVWPSVFSHAFYMLSSEPEFIQFVNLDQLKDNTFSHDMCFSMTRLEYAFHLHLKEPP